MLKTLRYPCKGCNKILEDHISQVEAKRSKSFCSLSCRKKFKHLTKKCNRCGKDFEILRSRNKKKYCSFECATDGLRELWKSPEERKNRSFIQSFNKNSNWKNGIQERMGYVYICYPGKHLHKSKGAVLRSVLTMEKHIGRKLRKEEIVHHINQIKTDDRIENLMLFPNQAEHTRHHCNLRWGNI